MKSSASFFPFSFRQAAVSVATLFLASASAAIAETTVSWAETSPMNFERVGHTATTLADGRILVAGGSTNSGTTASAEIYDPAKATWTLTGSMATPRTYHTATLLRDGTVLVAGGLGAPHDLSGSERYNPATGLFTPTASMSFGRADHRAVLLTDGRVLVAGERTS